MKSQVQIKKSRMLISKDRALYKEIDSSKTATGSFYTKKDIWLLKPVVKFLEKALKEKNEILHP